jgi:DNA polymerase-1
MNKYSLDLETTTLSPFEPHAAIICMTVYDWQTGETRQYDESNLKLLLANAKSLLTDKAGCLVGHNVKFDLLWLRWAGCPVSVCQFFDTQIAASLTVLGTQIGLEDLVVRKLKLKPWKIDRHKMREHSLETILEYNKLDVDYTTRIARLQEKELTKREQWPLFTMLCEMIPVLVAAELKGLKIKDLSPLIQEHTQKAWIAHGRIYSTKVIDASSTKAVLTHVKQFGCPSTDVFDLRKLALRVPAEKDFVENLLAYRKSTKLLGTYLNPYRAKTRLFPSYRVGKSEIGGSAFGRLACADPNLQQYPEWLLKAILDEKLIKADYSQIELRTAAFLSRDPVMLRAFKSGHDLHSAALAKMTGNTYNYILEHAKEPEWIERRRGAKANNFSRVYLGGLDAVWNSRLKAGEIYDYEKQFEQTQTQYEEWSQTFKHYLRWANDTINEGERKGWLRGPLGRLIRTTAFRGNQLISFLVSGLAAEIGHMASATLARNSLWPRVFIHDALYFDPGIDVTNVKAIMTEGVIQYMAEKFGVEFDVPLEVSIGPLS